MQSHTTAPAPDVLTPEKMLDELLPLINEERFPVYNILKVFTHDDHYGSFYYHGRPASIEKIRTELALKENVGRPAVELLKIIGNMAAEALNPLTPKSPNRHILTEDTLKIFATLRDDPQSSILSRPGIISGIKNCLQFRSEFRLHAPLIQMASLRFSFSQMFSSPRQIAEHRKNKLLLTTLLNSDIPLSIVNEKVMGLGSSATDPSLTTRLAMIVKEINSKLPSPVSDEDYTLGFDPMRNGSQIHAENSLLPLFTVLVEAGARFPAEDDPASIQLFSMLMQYCLKPRDDISRWNALLMNAIKSGNLSAEVLNSTLSSIVAHDDLSNTYKFTLIHDFLINASPTYQDKISIKLEAELINEIIASSANSSDFTRLCTVFKSSCIVEEPALDKILFNICSRYYINPVGQHNNCLELANLLIQRGADPSILIDLYPEDPLCISKSDKLNKVLLNDFAKFNDLPLDRQIECVHFAKFLISHGASPFVLLDMYNNPIAMAALPTPLPSITDPLISKFLKSTVLDPAFGMRLDALSLYKAMHNGKGGSLTQATADKVNAICKSSKGSTPEA
ncbi:MAG: hypothetical protein Q7V63_01520 [Gammaproteobacteria bacterium]|nr:hypothetical protein [Gammaproteobacteria bacterium]